MGTKEFFDSLAAVTLEERVGEFEYAELDHRWYGDGTAEGPAVCYYAGDGSALGPPRSYSRFSKVFRPMGRQLRDEQGRTTGTMPNRLYLRVTRGGIWQGGFEFDPNVDVEYEKRARRVLGDAAYEHYKRTDEEAAAPLRAPTHTNAAPMSAAELLGFIHTELVKDLPIDWTTLEVEGEVWFEGDQRNISTNYYFTNARGEHRQFSASNTFGPMNAIGELHKNFHPQGKPWRKLKLQFTNGSGTVMADSE